MNAYLRDRLINGTELSEACVKLEAAAAAVMAGGIGTNDLNEIEHALGVKARSAMSFERCAQDLLSTVGPPPYLRYAPQRNRQARS